MTITRFAPSPSGFLHLGNARTAILNAVFAHHHKGQMLLRFDDTDALRSRQSYKDQIREDLQWLGVVWDKEYMQSERAELYQAQAQSLKDKGLLYPCYESERELKFSRQMQKKGVKTKGDAPIYNRQALQLTDKQKSDFERDGRRPYWRFKLSHQTCEINDIVKGKITIQTSSLSDPVIIRADGGFLYMLPSVVDDLDMKISHIIRGDDHVTNSAIHIELARALGAKKLPFFAHHPLMLGEDGAPLSKREGSFSLKDFRKTGFEPQSLFAFLLDKADLGDDERDFKHIARENIRFDEARLLRLNRQALQSMTSEEALSRRALWSADFWNRIKGNLSFFHEGDFWWEVMNGQTKIAKQKDAQALLKIALETLPQEPWDEDIWSHWIDEMKTRTDLRGKALYLPLRLALSGEAHGPEMKNLILLLGYEQIKKRLLTSF